MELMMLNCLSYASGLIIYIFNRKHFLMMFLSLEFIVLSIFMSCFMILDYEYMNMSMMLIFLTMCMCEGILSLSLMVMMIRVIGNDKILSYSMLG